MIYFYKNIIHRINFNNQSGLLNMNFTSKKLDIRYYTLLFINSDQQSPLF